MRKFFVIFILILGIGASLPYGMGYLAERQMFRIVEEVSKRPHVKVTVERYQRGYLSSTADLSIKLQAVFPEHDGKPTPAITQADIKLTQTISHGPIILGKEGLSLAMAYVKSYVELPPQAKAALNALLNTPAAFPEFEIDSTIHINGASAHHFALPKHNFMPHGSQFLTEGLHGFWETSSDLDYHTGDFSLKSFLFKRDDRQLALKNPELVFDVFRNDIDLFTGKSRLTFPSMVMSKSGQNLFELKQLEFDSDSTLDKDRLNVAFDGAFERLQFAGQSYGPLLLKLSLQNLQAKKVVQIRDLVDQMQDPSLSKLQQDALVARLIEQLSALLQAGVKLEIAPLSVTMPNGKIRLTGQIQSLAQPQTDDKPKGFDVTKHIDGQLQLTLSRAVVQEMVMAHTLQEIQRQQHLLALRKPASANPSQQHAPEKPLSLPEMVAQAKGKTDVMLNALESAGFLKREQDDERVFITLKQGTITINGKPIPNLLGLLG